jgi:2,3-bisphosphoglycerate-independent phosphoglycerate mutase
LKGQGGTFSNPLQELNVLMAGRSGVFLIVDGLGDLPVTGLDGLTPLEAALTPNLDSMARSGEIGLVDPIGEGITPMTHSGVAMLMGLPPEQIELLRRGPIEAAGAGLALDPNQIALRANFASFERTAGGLAVIDRRAGRIKEGTISLASCLQDIDLGDGVTGSLISTDEHRGVLVLSGPDLAASITDTDPGDSGMPSTVLQSTGSSPGNGTSRFNSDRTAEKVNRFVAESHERLKEHPVNLERLKQGLLPANGVLTRSAGALINLDNVINRQGIRTAVVAGCNTVIGLGRLFGFSIITSPRFTGNVDTDLEGKIAAVADGLRNHQLVFLHIKATDVCAHDRQPEKKRDFLVRLDEVLQPLLGQGFVLALTADHTTDSNTGMHTADPVPSLIYRPDFQTDHSDVRFGESTCADGSLPRQPSHEFLRKTLYALND